MARDAFHKKVSICKHCGALALFKMRGKTCDKCKFGTLEITRVPKGLKI